MLRKKRLKCGRIPARLFLACHQKSNTFKCKQFCCAKPMCAYLSVGYAPRPQQRRAALPNSRLSISCSAHSHSNALELERVRARASCFASRSLAYLNQPLLLRRGYLKLDYEGRAESPVSTLQKFVLIPNLSLTHDKAYPWFPMGRL